MNPFVQFIIGGDYRIEFKRTTDGKTVRSDVGDLGLVFKSNVIKNVNDNESEEFVTHIDTEARSTYYEIMRNRLHFEVWTWNNWELNKFLAIKSIPLLDIVSGSINRDLHFVKVNRKKEKSVCNLSF